MIRDFSDQKKEELKTEIDKVNASTWSPITDGIQDVLLQVAEAVHILDVARQFVSVSTYHSLVLDMNDTTKQDLDKIFKKVKSVDREYETKITAIVERIQTYNKKVDKLAQLINPNFSIVSATAIKSELADLNKSLKKMDTAIDKSYKKELDEVKSQLVGKALKNAAGNFLGLAVSVAALPYKMAKNLSAGNVAGTLSSVWDLVNSSYSLMGSGAALIALGVASLKFINYNSAQKEYMLDTAESYLDAKGMAGVLTANEETGGKDAVTSFMKSSASMLDTINDGYKLVDGTKKFVKDPKSIISTKDYEHKVLKKADMVERYQNDGWKRMQNIYNIYEEKTFRLSKIKDAYDYMSFTYELSQDEIGSKEGEMAVWVNDNLIENKVVDLIETGEKCWKDMETFLEA